MKDPPIYDEPSSVSAEDGTVLIDGPDHVLVGMTPDAAEETSNRLLERAMEARGQLYFRKDRKD